MIKYYEELRREMEYREFRAQWRIRRRELDSARAQFLTQEQSRLDSLEEQMTLASGAQTPARTPDLPDAQPRREVEEKTSTVSKDERVSTPVSVPSPSLVSLIASGVRTDALLRSEQQKNSAGLADSIAVTADIVASEESVSSENESASGEKLKVQTTQLSSEAAASDNRARKTWDNPEESAARLEKVKEEGTGRKTWETPDGELKIASPLPRSHPSDSSVQFAIYGDKRKSVEEKQTPGSGLHDDAFKTNMPHVSDSSMQNILYPSTPSVPTSGLDAQASSFQTQPSDSDSGGLVTGHPSDSTAQDIFYGSSRTQVSPEASSQGHPSDSSVQGLMYISGAQERASSESRLSEHGHPSDSSVSTLLYPTTVNTPIPHSPRLSPHGHPSDSQVSLCQDSGNGLNTAQILRHSSRSTWQDPSDASVQKLLGDMSILGESQHTTRGTPPPSVVQDILYPGPDTQSASSVCHSRGTQPQSVAQDILYPRGDESGQLLSAVHTRGAPPPSVIQDIMYPSGEGTGREETRVSTRGQEPEVKITKIMYYVKDSEGESSTDAERIRIFLVRCALKDCALVICASLRKFLYKKSSCFAF